mgnify:CR=1 FL=1
MLLDFKRGAFPAWELEPEDGIPVPCVQNQPWVNEDTLATLARLRIPRTDPWGRPLPGEPDDPVLPLFRAKRR